MWTPFIVWPKEAGNLFGAVERFDPKAYTAAVYIYVFLVAADIGYVAGLRIKTGHNSNMAELTGCIIVIKIYEIAGHGDEGLTLAQHGVSVFVYELIQSEVIQCTVFVGGEPVDLI